jgi:hypothetical protein
MRRGVLCVGGLNVGGVQGDWYRLSTAFNKPLRIWVVGTDAQSKKERRIIQFRAGYLCHSKSVMFDDYLGL